MNMKTVLSLVVAVALGLSATWVGRSIVLANRAGNANAGRTTSVVVAKGDLEPGDLIGISDLTLAEMPVASVSKAMLTDLKPLVGRAVISPVVKGQALFEGLLAPPGSEGGLQALVPRGMRAVSVEVTESSGVAGLLIPGCRVDVIATLTGDQRERMARTIVENAKVQAVNRKLSRDRADDAASTTMKTVTLIVSPKDAEAIELASHSGKVRLVLRGTTDNTPTASPGVSFAELTGLVMPVDSYFETAEEPVGSESGMREFISGFFKEGGNTVAAESRPTASRRPSVTRRSVRVIRGNSEGTIVYELRSPNPGPRTEADWAVSTDGGQRLDEPVDPFGSPK